MRTQRYNSQHFYCTMLWVCLILGICSEYLNRTTVACQQMWRRNNSFYIVYFRIIFSSFFYRRIFQANYKSEIGFWRSHLVFKS